MKPLRGQAMLASSGEQTSSNFKLEWKWVQKLEWGDQKMVLEKVIISWRWIANLFVVLNIPGKG